MFHLHKVILKVNVVQTIGGNGKQVILKYRSPTCFKGTAQATANYPISLIVFILKAYRDEINSILAGTLRSTSKCFLPELLSSEEGDTPFECFGESWPRHEAVDIAKFAGNWNRKKTVEGRLCDGEALPVKVGTTIIMNTDADQGQPPLHLLVSRIAHYPSFMEYLSTEGLETCLPGCKSLEDGVAVYRSFYTEVQERQHGILAFQVTVVP